jgi:hypothetical protein
MIAAVGTKLPGQQFVGAPWTPDLLSPAGWWDASVNEDVIIYPGNLVGEWLDRSGNGRDMVQAVGAYQPEYIPEYINGKKVISFNGANWLQHTASPAGLLPVGQITNVAYVSRKNIAGAIGMVYYANNNPVPGVTTSDTKWDGRGSGGADILEASEAHNDFADSTRMHFQDAPTFYSNPASSTIDTTSPPNIPLVVCQFNRASQAVLSHLINVVTVYETVSSVSNWSKDHIATTIVLGGHGSLGTPTRRLNGAIAEVIVWTGALTDATRNKVEGYLAWKWGLVSGLPANHPYKNGAPTV